MRRTVSADVVVQESERLRIELLERLCETTQTFIELTELELKVGNGPHLAEGIRHVEQSLNHIRKIMPDVSFAAERARISEKLAEFERRAGGLKKHGSLKNGPRPAR